MTAQQDDEEALVRYREIFEVAPLGFATLENTDTIAEINKCGADLLGAAPAMLVGSRFTLHVAPPSLMPFSNMITAVQTSGTAITIELELSRHGAAVPVRMHASVMHHEQPTVLLAFEDISERKAKENEVARTERALHDAARRKDEFLSALSHELRNPLAPIRMSVSVLQMLGIEDAKAREAIEIIARSSAHLSRLIDDLLDITRITRGKIVVKRETLELSSLVQRVVDEHAGQFTANGIALEVNPSLTPLWVHGDPERLVQIVRNLLGNAEKFTPTGGRVTVTTEVRHRAVLLRIRDTGIGIAPDVIGELGVPFVQAPQAIDRSRGGLGLGLAMVRTLAELHGGSLAIRSDGVGRGTEVIVSLPEHLAPPPVVADEQPQPGPAVRRRVLLVEDNIDAARSLAKALDLRGHSVDVVHDGRDGIARAAELVPDVVLCDLGLPDCDGYTVARRLRRDERLRDVVLVALSGYARPDDVSRSAEAGFDVHLAKPASLTDIEAILRDLPRR